MAFRPSEDGFSSRGAAYAAHADDYGRSNADNDEIVTTHAKFRMPVINTFGPWICYTLILLAFMGTIQQMTANLPILYFKDTETASYATASAASVMATGLVFSQPIIVLISGPMMTLSFLMSIKTTRLAWEEFHDCQDIHNDAQSLEQARNQYAAYEQSVVSADAAVLGAAVQGAMPGIRVLTHSGGACAGVIYSNNIYRFQQALMLIHGLLMIGGSFMLTLGFILGFRHLVRWLRVRRSIEIYQYKLALSQDPPNGPFRKLLMADVAEQIAVEHKKM